MIMVMLMAFPMDGFAMQVTISLCVEGESNLPFVLEVEPTDRIEDVKAKI